MLDHAVASQSSFNRESNEKLSSEDFCLGCEELTISPFGLWISISFVLTGSCDGAQHAQLPDFAKPDEEHGRPWRVQRKESRAVVDPGRHELHHDAAACEFLCLLISGSTGIIRYFSNSICCVSRYRWIALGFLPWMSGSSKRAFGDLQCHHRITAPFLRLPHAQGALVKETTLTLCISSTERPLSRLAEGVRKVIEGKKYQ